MTENTRKESQSSDDCVLVPLADIYETTDNYTLKLEMPGVTRDRLDITLDKNELLIKAGVEEYRPEQKDLKYSEFSPHDFYRAFTVGSDVDRNGINATFENGVLTLVLQKQESVKPKKIAINVA